MRTLALGVATAVIAVSLTARADDLAEARRLAAALEYDRALAIVDAALARGGSDPTRVVELHLLAGQLAAGLDRAAVAEDHFARALSLRPTAALPAGSSPKLTEPFEAARARGLSALRAHAEIASTLARVAVDDDPLGVIVGIEVDVVDATGAHAELVARGATHIAIPLGTRAVEVSALDADGNRVWISPLEAAPAVVHGDHIAWWARWSTWAIGGGVVLAAGSVFGWRSSVAQTDWNALRAADGMHDYSEATAVESRGRAYAITADVGFGLAAAAGITAIVLAVRPRDDRPTIAISARSGQLAVSFDARF